LTSGEEDWATAKVQPLNLMLDSKAILGRVQIIALLIASSSNRLDDGTVAVRKKSFFT
jgi:hypothetical protein